MGNQLRLIRERRKISQEKLGELVGTDKSTISKLEQGKRQLTARWLKGLAKALNVSQGEILGDPATPSSPLSTGAGKELVTESGQDLSTTTQEVQLTDPEERLLIAFRSVDDTTRETILKEVVNIADQFKFDQQKRFSARRA